MLCVCESVSSVWFQVTCVFICLMAARCLLLASSQHILETDRSQFINSCFVFFNHLFISFTFNANTRWLLTGTSHNIGARCEPTGGAQPSSSWPARPALHHRTSAGGEILGAPWSCRVINISLTPGSPLLLLLSYSSSSSPQLCLLCSVGYHLFCCHRSEKTSRRWMALDYTGVSIGILGCYVPGVFYTFYCNNVRPQFLLLQHNTHAHTHTRALGVFLYLYLLFINSDLQTHCWFSVRVLICSSFSSFSSAERRRRS